MIGYIGWIFFYSQSWWCHLQTQCIFLTVVQNDTFERNIGTNNITALAAIQEDIRRHAELEAYLASPPESPTDSDDPNESSDEKQAIDALKTEYKDFPEILKLDPNNILYTNVKQRFLVASKHIILSTIANFFWDYIITPIWEWCTKIPRGIQCICLGFFYRSFLVFHHRSHMGVI